MNELIKKGKSVADLTEILEKTEQQINKQLTFNLWEEIP